MKTWCWLGIERRKFDSGGVDLNLDVNSYKFSAVALNYTYMSCFTIVINTISGTSRRSSARAAILISSKITISAFRIKLVMKMANYLVAVKII